MVGCPIWSSTNFGSTPSATRRNSVFTMLLPYRPHTHEMRTMLNESATRATSCSPAHFERPYTDVGFGTSHSSYGEGLVPSNT